MLKFVVIIPDKIVQQNMRTYYHIYSKKRHSDDRVWAKNAKMLKDVFILLH